MCVKGQPRLQHVASWYFNQRRLWAQRMTGTKFQGFVIKDLNLNRKLFIAIYVIWKKGIFRKVLVDPGRTWTCNLRCRKPTPYPLGHRAAVMLHICVVSFSSRYFNISLQPESDSLIIYMNPFPALCIAQLLKSFYIQWRKLCMW